MNTNLSEILYLVMSSFRLNQSRMVAFMVITINVLAINIASVAGQSNIKPTVAEVKRVIEFRSNDTAKSFNKDTVARITSWNSPIKIGEGVSDYLYEIGDVVIYAVNTDYTVRVDNPRWTQAMYYKGGTYNFRKDKEGNWTFLVSAEKPPTVIYGALKRKPKTNKKQ